MKFKTFYTHKNKAERKQYADDAKTTPGYIENHLLPRRKIPRKPSMERLVLASNGKLTVKDMLNHFYGDAA